MTDTLIHFTVIKDKSGDPRRHPRQTVLRLAKRQADYPLFVSSFLVLLAKKVGMCACIKQDEDKFLFAYFPDE